MLNLARILFGIAAITNYVFAQNWPANIIDVHINSGNPRYPFPQFQEYTSGRSLALHNPIGVVHAEMEQTTRDAYRIMMNRAIYTGTVLNPGPNEVRYITFNENVVPHNYGTFVSEGDGYALLAAAYMCDKKTFDGLWCWMHDNRLSVVKRYINCADLRPTYPFGPYTFGWNNNAATPAGSGNNDAASDGDFDVALALLMAYRQWGENSGIVDACGEEINYRKEALHFIKALVDTTYWDNGSMGFSPGSGFLTGNIGIDGYVKSGNTWGELTTWRPTAPAPYVWANPVPSPLQVTGRFFDYFAPGYFRAFADFIQEQITNTDVPVNNFHISQFRRAEASSDWLMGRLHAQGHLPFSGSVTVNNDGSVVSFANTGLAGEDFRLPKRTLINQMWHGNPIYNWNPATHAIVPGTNTHSLDNAQRLGQFFERPANFPGGIGCAKHGQDPVDIQFDGITWVHGANFMNGAPYSSVFEYTNWTWGSSAPGIVLNGNDEITAKTYRQLELEWDVVEDKPNTEFERYLGSTPKYFHGWFRVFGLLVTTGNFHSPRTFAAAPTANMKIYKAVSKTYGFPGDTLTYTLSYRNYASVTANGVTIVDVLPPELEFVSATGAHSVAGNTVTWNIGTVPGFQTSTGVNPTKGFVKVICRIRNTATDRFCNKAIISCTNGSGWESNEYPNNITATMERNCVDIVNRALSISKTASRTQMNPGDEVNFKLEFENSTNAGWLDGGRPGISVTHGYGYSGPNTANLYFRIFHGAQEAYINYGNYRVSYFVNDPAKSGFFPADPSGWTFQVNILEGGNINKVQYMFQKIPFGEDPINGRKWDQRLVVKFSDTLGALSQHLYKYFGVTGRVHRGAKEPFRTMLKLESNPSTPMSPQLADDWSFDGDASPLNIGSNDKDLFFPITPDWTEKATYPTGKPVTKVHIDECRNKPPNFDRVLVEEFDGYTWRRSHGRGPLPGRETYNVVVHDTLPIHLDWAGFIDDNALGITATYNPTTRVIEWKIPVMLVGAKGDLSYKTIANGNCPAVDRTFENRAWIWSQTDSKLMSKVDLLITCDPVPPPPPSLTSMTKTANKTSYSPGEAITYNINYIQTHGTIAQHSFNNTANWIAPAGSPGLPTNFSDLTAPWTAPKYFYHNRSHGTDGMLNFSINISNGWPNFSLLFRYQSGQPGTASHNGVALNVWPGRFGVNAGVIFSVMNDNTKIAGSDPNTPIIHPFTPGNPVMNFIVVLKGGNMRIWINAADTLSSPPIASYNGLKTQPGYVGFFNGKSDALMGGGDNGNNRPVNWRSHFDSAFDLQISDPLPSGLTFNSANNGGTHNAGIVTWPIQSGPVLKGTTYNHNLTATVNTCTQPFITNTAYANMLGQPTNSIGAQSIVGCLTATPVTWTWVNIKEKENQNQLVWQVSKANDNGQFEVMAFSQNTWLTIGFQNSNASQHTYAQALPELENPTLFKVVYHEADAKSYSPIVSFKNKKQITLRPNPTSSNSTLELGESVFNLKIYNSSGQLVVNKEEATGSLNFGEDFPAGVYHLILQNEDQQKTYHWLKL